MVSWRSVWIGIAVIFAIECVLLLWVLADRQDVTLGTEAVQAQDVPTQEVAQAQETGTCPSPQLIDTFEGNGDQQSDTFETTTNSFRVSYEFTDSDPEFPGQLFIDVIDADDPNQFPVADATQDGSGTGETFVNEPPGAYFLDITSFGGEYTITVEQCEGGGGSTNPGGGEGAPTPAPQPAPSPEPRPEPPRNRGGGGLMEAGGPKHGPMPTKMDGSCPKDYPVKRGIACHKR